MTDTNNIELFQEVFTQEATNYLNIREQRMTHRFITAYFVLPITLTLLFLFLLVGNMLDSSCIITTETTMNVLGSNEKNYADEAYADVILINDTVGVSDDLIQDIRISVAYELAYLSDEFVDEFLETTKFEIEIRDTYCYSAGFGGNYFLHRFDKYNFSNINGYIGGYYADGLLRLHAYTMEDDIFVNLRNNVLHELGHHFDGAKMRFSHSDTFMEIYDTYTETYEVLTVRTTPVLTDDGNFAGVINSTYFLSAPEELFAEMFKQYIKYPDFVETYYPDIFHYFENLLGK